MKFEVTFTLHTMKSAAGSVFYLLLLLLLSGAAGGIDVEEGIVNMVVSCQLHYLKTVTLYVFQFFVTRNIFYVSASTFRNNNLLIFTIQINITW